jgi:hypothetical protein
VPFSFCSLQALECLASSQQDLSSILLSHEKRRPFLKIDGGLVQQDGCSEFSASPQIGVDGRQYTWSIGIYVGSSLRGLHSPAEIANPVLSARDVSDVPAAFVADPFMLRKDNLWYMFFEVFNTLRGKGEIAMATSRDGSRWDYCEVVLQEPFHLSYPYVLSWNGHYYLIPETEEAGSVRLYKASAFPREWEFCATLIEQDHVDPSLFWFNGCWWMFASPRKAQEKDGSLVLFYADDLCGPWKSHAQNPIVHGNQLMARPAGRVLVKDGQVIRFAQDKHNPQGNHVRAFRVLELTASSYRETEIEGGPILGPSGAGWNKSGMHHIDLHDDGDGQYIACVDGVIRESATL